MKQVEREVEANIEAKHTDDTLEKLSSNVIWVSFASMFNDISGEIVIRAVPLFLVGILGVGYSVVGLIEGLSDTTSALLKIIAGRYSDTWGSRKKVAAFGYGLTAVARPILYFTTSWVLPLVSRIVDRAGKGIRTAPRDALIADSVSPKMRGRAFGFHRAMDPLGAVIGALIAAAVLYTSGMGTSHSTANSGVLTGDRFRLLVLIATIPTVLSSVILFFFVKDVRSPAKTIGNQNRSIWNAGIDKRFNQFLGVLVLFTLGLSSDAFLLLRASSLGISAAEIFIMIACFNLVTTLAAYPSGILSDRLSRKTVLRIGWIYYALIYFGFAFATEQWQIWTLFIAYGLYYGLTEGVEKAFIADLAVPEMRGTAYGLYNGSVGIMVLPASLIAGLLWQNVGVHAPFIFGGALGLIAAIAISIVRNPKPADPALEGALLN